MTDPQPLVCVFFQLPPSDQTFKRIHDIPWDVFLPQLEKLTTALATLLVNYPSSTAMQTLFEARRVMGGKMIPLRDVMLSGRDFSRHYVKFVDGVSENKMLSTFVKGAYSIVAQKAAKRTEDAQLALSEFREELQSVVGKVIAVVSGNNNDISSFITESSLAVSVMIDAIEECRALLQECNEGFLNINKQGFDRESFERNPPSDAEFELVREKWETLENYLHDISVDWSLLEARMGNPRLNRTTSDVAPDEQNTVTPTGISVNPIGPEATPDVPHPENAVDSEAPPNLPPSKKAKIPFWRKFYQRISTCFSSRPFC